MSNNLKYDPKKGYWHSEKSFQFDLPFAIRDVTKIGKALVQHLKNSNLPFKYSQIFDTYFDKETDKNMKPYYKKGYVMIWVKRQSIVSKINPFHNTKYGDETIVIDFSHGSSFLFSYQEIKHEYVGTKITWKLSLEDIKKFKEILENFCKGKQISISQINPSRRGN